MWSCVLLLLCTYAHGAPVDVPKPGLCKDPSALGAARLALTKINQDRTQGYVLSLNRLCNVNQMPHEPMGMVYYLTMDILETKCHVLSKKDWKDCEVRSMDQTPVYGQCKATIYINKVQRIVNLHSYSCTMRPASASKIHKICPDCPSLMPLDSDTILKTVEKSLEEFNKKSGLSNYFALLNVTRASAQRGIAMFDFVEFTIQETTCSNSTDVSEAPKCTLMGCEFAHKGHCKGTRSGFDFKEHIKVNCDIYEPEVGEKEKSRHLLGGEHNHSHHHSHEHGAGHHHHGHSHEHGHHHNHSHGHSHEEKEKSRPLLGGEHDHSHEHNHDHVHDHHHSHDHKDEHGHHHAHNHSQDHNHTHNHEHKHLHLHAHEHHHDHDDHHHKTPIKNPIGTVHYLPSADQPMTIPSFPDQPAAPRGDQPMTLSVFPGAHGHGPKVMKLIIPPFPSTISPECPGEPVSKDGYINELFTQDPLFQHKAH